MQFLIDKRVEPVEEMLPVREDLDPPLHPDDHPACLPRKRGVNRLPSRSIRDDGDAYGPGGGAETRGFTDLRPRGGGEEGACDGLFDERAGRCACDDVHR